MSATDLYTMLRANTYPGRGILMGKTPDALHAVMAYFIMGRSENSRNRIFVSEGDTLFTRAHDPSKMTDPSLVIYAPVRTIDGRTIVTNGDQTDTIFSALKEGGTFSQALKTRTFEPDAPNFTPRISGLMEPDGSYQLSILKSAEGDPAAYRRYFYDYAQPLPGQGHFLHTYQEDGNPLPSFRGEPHCFSTENDMDTFGKALWESLHPNNKISLFVRYLHLTSGETRTTLYNKN